MSLFRPREYHRPKDLRDATWLLSNFGKRARIIAGGTDLLIDKPPGIECLVDISNLNLAYIRKDGDKINIGAAATLDSIEGSRILSSEPYRVITETVSQMATPTVRNMATIGGNLCNASPAADLPLALMVLDSTVKIVGLSGSRILPVGDFFEGVNQTVLGEDELLAEVQIPLNPENSRAAFMKLRHHQTAIDLAIVNVATRLTCSDGICEDVRIALGAVATTPIYARKAEKLLAGKRPYVGIIGKAAEAASEESKPIGDVRASAGYRKRMVAVLVKRAIEAALGGM